MDLSDCQALVTGASRGLGAALAERLRANGAAVIAGARSFTEALTDPPKSGALNRVRLDVALADSVNELAHSLNRLQWEPSVLVNNAGFSVFEPIELLSEEAWSTTIGTNLSGAFRCTKAVLPGMKQRGSGRIINIGSIADHVVLPDNAAYACSKFGLRALTEAINVEAAALGVRASLLSLGATDTPIWDQRPGFDRSAMLHVEQVVDTLMHLVTRPASVRLDEIKLFPPKRVL